MSEPTYEEARARLQAEFSGEIGADVKAILDELDRRREEVERLQANAHELGKIIAGHYEDLVQARAERDRARAELKELSEWTDGLIDETNRLQNAERALAAANAELDEAKAIMLDMLEDSNRGLNSSMDAAEFLGLLAADTEAPERETGGTK